MPSTKRCAFTATSACRRSTPARTACSSKELVQVPVQVDDAALRRLRNGQVREARLVHAALRTRKVLVVLVEDEPERKIVVGADLDVGGLRARCRVARGMAQERERVDERVVG